MRTSGITLKQLLSNFVTIERFRFELHDNNRFAFTLGKVQRHHEFLLIIQERYDVLGKEMSELERKTRAIFERDTQGQERGSRQSTPEENEMSKRLIELNLKIHLEIETFYSNAKILLDHIAHAIYAHFGQAQHCSLESHDRFLKDFDKYVSQKGLSIPEGMREMAKGLSKRIIVFRDKMINHEMDPNRSHSICMVQGAEPLVFSQKIEGTLDDFRSTEPMSVLMRDLERYIVYFMTVIKENEAKTVLKLAAVPSWEKQRPDSYPEKQV